MISVEQSGNAVSEKAVDFIYNQSGQFDEINRFSDLVRISPVAMTNYAYDAVNRLTDLDHLDPSGSTFAFFDYQYDVASRITHIKDVHGITGYSYDRRSQLTGADRDAADLRVDESYSYDANGNRLSSHLHGDVYKTDPGNRTLNDSVYRYEYDAEGNMTKRIEIATDSFREFRWDHRNRLVAVADYNSSAILVQEVVYKYDAFNRRISKDVLSESGNETSTSYAYQGDNVLLQFFDADGRAVNSEYELAVRNLNGVAVDQILSSEIANEQTEWYFSDHLGSAIAVLNSTGGGFENTFYDAFGQADAAVSTRGFTARETEVELGLVYYRARYYSPELGRFISEDPLGFTGRDANLYRYVSNVPHMHTDPFGLVIDKAILAVVAGSLLLKQYLEALQTIINRPEIETLEFEKTLLELEHGIATPPYCDGLDPTGVSSSRGNSPLAKEIRRLELEIKKRRRKNLELIDAVPGRGGLDENDGQEPGTTPTLAPKFTNWTHVPQRSRTSK